MIHDNRQGGGPTWRVLYAAAFAFLFALGACSPVDTWRHLTGTSKYDPNPATTPNSGNLAAGAALPYPNLATVPPPPSSELTEAQLEELRRSLVADRKNARHTSQQLRVGLGPAEPPPSPAAPAPPAPAAAASSAKGRAAGGSGTMTSGLRKPGQPPEPGPMESSLVSPQIPETPRPEEPEPAPPPPRIVAIPASTAGGAHLPAAPPAPPLPANIPPFEPPPAPPVLTPPMPAQTAMTTPKAKKPSPAPAAKPIVEITFAAGSSSLDDSERTALDKLAARWRQNPGTLRIVGYATAAGDPLASFRRALDQAQAVAAALTKGGIPANKMAIEASPAATPGDGDRAEVLLVH